MKIGYKWPKNYAHERCISFQEEHEFIDCDNLRNLDGPWWQNKIFDFMGDDFDVDIYHFFNCVHNGTKPWVSTFESILPRTTDTLDCYREDSFEIYYPEDIQSRMEFILKDNCLGIIPISKWAEKLQTELFNRMDIVGFDKMFQIYPPQKLNTRKPVEYDTKDKLKIIFIGNAFWRKGGTDVLRAIQNIVDIELTIISKMMVDPHAAVESDRHFKETEECIKNNDWIIHHDGLENEEVLKLISKSHLALLPTYSDTFGYSVLECQSFGVPVITTDVSALSEINNNDCGWVIKIDKNIWGEGLGHIRKSHRFRNRETIIRGIRNIIQTIRLDSKLIERKSKACIERIEKVHDPKKISNEIKKVYDLRKM